ncbi:winged helix-turn-helix transcriptional regulator [Ectothiorhodospiraceae bacterium BW-2]|nr:winged helix-turn-helix transcriptional regulator [Ectothiorhodospiraceae bacterium BW-2]
MANRQHLRQEDNHFRLLRLLEQNPTLTQRELAEQIGMSLDGVNYCLNALIDKGFVKMDNFQQQFRVTAKPASLHSLAFLATITPPLLNISLLKSQLFQIVQQC